MARFISVCTSLDPKDVVTIPCDQFDVNDDGSISAYYNGELWGHFVEYEYAHIVDDEVLEELALDEETEESESDETEPQYSVNGHVPLEVVVPDDTSELDEDEDDEVSAPAAVAEDDDASR